MFTHQIRKFVNIVLCDVITNSGWVTRLRGGVEDISISTISLCHLQSHSSCGSPPENLTSSRLRAEICSTLLPVWQICLFCQPVLEKTLMPRLCVLLPIPSGKLCTLPPPPLPNTPVNSNHTLLMEDPINSSLHATNTLSLGIVSDLFP